MCQDTQKCKNKVITHADYDKEIRQNFLKSTANSGCSITFQASPALNTIGSTLVVSIE